MTLLSHVLPFENYLFTIYWQFQFTVEQKAWNRITLSAMRSFVVIVFFTLKGDSSVAVLIERRKCAARCVWVYFICVVGKLQVIGHGWNTFLRIFRTGNGGYCFSEKKENKELILCMLVGWIGFDEFLRKKWNVSGKKRRSVDKRIDWPMTRRWTHLSAKRPLPQRLHLVHLSASSFDYFCRSIRKYSKREVL